MDDHATVHEVMSFFALMLIAPYVIGAPVAVVWVAVAWAVRWLTGWGGLLPADVWHAGDKNT